MELQTTVIKRGREHSKWRPRTTAERTEAETRKGELELCV